MSRALKQLEFVYDVLSPYSYIGFELLKRHSATWNSVRVKYTPVAIGGLFKTSKNQSPAMVPLKGKYMPIDLERHRQVDNVSIRIPEVRTANKTGPTNKATPHHYTTTHHYTPSHKMVCRLTRCLFHCDCSHRTCTMPSSRKVWKHTPQHVLCFVL